jgi:hypothetical protein
MTAVIAPPTRRQGVRGPWPAFALLAVVAVGIWQFVAADLTFMGDDWKVLGERTLSVDSLLTPYNEHLSAIPIALLVILRDTIGLGWHAVYLLPVQLGLVLAAAGVLVIATRRQRHRVGLVLAALALFMGSGWDDLLWAWQVGAVISTAAGVWALVCLDTPRPRSGIAAGLVVVALASSSFGIPFAAAVAALAAIRRKKMAIALLALVGLAYLAWYARYHFTGPTICQPPSPVQLVWSTGPFAVAGLIYAVGAPLGLGQDVQVLVTVAADVAALWVIGLLAARKAGRNVGLPAAVIAGLVVMGALVAYGRPCLGGVQAMGSSRYVYVTGMLALVGLAGTELAGLVGRMVGAIPRVVVTGGIASVLLLQAKSIADGHAALRATSDTVRAGVAIVLSDATGLCHTAPVVVDEMTADIYMLPPPARLRELVASPNLLATPAWVPNGAPRSQLVANLRRMMCEVPPVAGE